MVFELLSSYTFSPTSVVNTVENIGSIMDVEPGHHILVTGLTECGTTSHLEPFSPSLIIFSSMPHSTLALRSLHWQYPPLGGSLVRTKHSSSSLILPELPDFLLKHCRCCLSLKTNGNAASRTSVCAGGRTGCVGRKMQG